MSNVRTIRLKPKVIVEQLGYDHGGRPVYATRLVDEEGFSFTDYIGTSYIDFLRVAHDMIEGDIEFIDRVSSKEVRR